MKFTRILALFLALLMLALTVVACDQEPETPPTPDNPPATDGDTPPEGEGGDTPAVLDQLNLVNKGETEYVIVRDYKAGPEVVDAVATIAEAFKIHLGAVIEVKLCYNDIPNEPTDIETAKEILVGTTNRQESTDAIKGLLAKDYVQKISGEKLILAGGGDKGTADCLANFMTQFIFVQGDRVGVANRGEKYDLIFKQTDTALNRGIYSYSKSLLLGARIDSYLIAYPKNGEGVQVQAAKDLAEKVYGHILAETGYELEMSKDTRAWGDYEILVGETARSEALYRELELGKDEYFIQLITEERTYEDGTTHEGGTLYICYGENAAEAAFTAFSKELMPSSSTLIELDLGNNFILTNRQ